jgi:MbtH protein
VSSIFDDQEGRFSVVVNDEEQYSIWPTGMAVPEGWRRTGPVDVARRECLDYIEQVWTDMRPKGIRP